VVIFDQWDVVEFDFSPTQGHEPAGRRPALVVSNAHYNLGTSMTLVCPITTVDHGFPLHFELPQELGTRGFVVAEQVRACDLATRRARRVETLACPASRSAIAECLRSFI
jgi:mRNA interferase MazF